MNNCILTHVFWWIVANSGSGSETLKWWPAFANALKYGTGFSAGISDIWVFVLYWETSIKESLIYRLFLPSVKSCTAVVVCREQEHLGKWPELVFAILNSLSFLLILSSPPCSFNPSVIHKLSVTSTIVTVSPHDSLLRNSDEEPLNEEMQQKKFPFAK